MAAVAYLGKIFGEDLHGERGEREPIRGSGVDVCAANILPAAARRQFLLGGGGAPPSFARRRRRLKFAGGGGVRRR